MSQIAMTLKNELTFIVAFLKTLKLVIHIFWTNQKVSFFFYLFYHLFSSNFINLCFLPFFSVMMIINSMLVNLIFLIPALLMILVPCAKKKSKDLMPRAKKPTNSMYTQFSKTPVPNANKHNNKNNNNIEAADTNCSLVTTGGDLK